MSKYQLFPFVVFLTTMVYHAALPRSAGAQQKSLLEQVQETDPANMQIDDATRVQEMLAWKTELEKHDLRSHVMTIEQLKPQIRREQEKLRNERNKLGDYAFATDTIINELIGETLKQLLQVKLDISASEAMVKFLAEELEKNGTIELREKQSQARQKALEMKQQAIFAQYEALRGDDQQPPDQAKLLNAKANAQRIAAEIAALEQERKAAANEVAEPLANVRLRLVENQARERVAMTQLQELNSIATDAGKTRKIQQDLDQLRAIFLERKRQMVDAEIAINETKRFLELIEYRLENHPDNPQSESKSPE